MKCWLVHSGRAWQMPKIKSSGRPSLGDVVDLRMELDGVQIALRIFDGGDAAFCVRATS